MVQPRHVSARQHGATTSLYRSAIACLERCLDSTATDAPLRASPAYNLELAKLLWNEARKKEKKPDNPNQDFPPEDPRSEPPPDGPSGFDPRTGAPESGDGNAGNESPKVVPSNPRRRG